MALDLEAFASMMKEEETCRHVIARMTFCYRNSQSLRATYQSHVDVFCATL